MFSISYFLRILIHELRVQYTKPSESGLNQYFLYCLPQQQLFLQLSPNHFSFPKLEDSATLLYDLFSVLATIHWIPYFHLYHSVVKHKCNRLARLLPHAVQVG